MDFFGLDEATEAQRLERENEIYDEIFKTAVPYTAGAPVAPGAMPEAPVENQKPPPNGTPEAPAVSGARGGRPLGGGTSRKSPAAIAKPGSTVGRPVIVMMT